MQKLGLTDVHTESLPFPRHVVDSQSLAATVDGAAMSPAFEVFEGSGAGHADADIVYVGTAHPSTRSPPSICTARSRSSIATAAITARRNITTSASAGAVAMLYNSLADGNLIQVGSVRFDGWSALGPIPAITIGNSDGAGARGGVHRRQDAARASSTCRRTPSRPRARTSSAASRAASPA